jgi:hypothetical protein
VHWFVRLGECKAKALQSSVKLSFDTPKFSGGKGEKGHKIKFLNFLLDKTKTTLVKSIKLNVFIALEKGPKYEKSWRPPEREGKNLAPTKKSRFIF